MSSCYVASGLKLRLLIGVLVQSFLGKPTMAKMLQPFSIFIKYLPPLLPRLLVHSAGSGASFMSPIYLLPLSTSLRLAAASRSLASRLTAVPAHCQRLP